MLHYCDMVKQRQSIRLYLEYLAKYVKNFCQNYEWEVIHEIIIKYCY